MRVAIAAAPLPTAAVDLIRADTLDPQSIFWGGVPHTVLADDLEQALVGTPMKAFTVVCVERLVVHTSPEDALWIESIRSYEIHTCCKQRCCLKWKPNG